MVLVQGFGFSCASSAVFLCKDFSQLFSGSLPDPSFSPPFEGVTDERRNCPVSVSSTADFDCPHLPII